MQKNRSCGLGLKNPIVIILSFVIITAFVALLIVNPHSRNSAYAFWGFITFWFGLYIYMLPSSMALANKHPKFIPILCINIFCGETILGWIIAIIWANYNYPS